MPSRPNAHDALPIVHTNNILLIVVIVVAGGAWSYVMFLRDEPVPLDKQEIVIEAQQRLVDNTPAIVSEAKGLAADVLPPVGAALYHRAQQDYPRYLRAVEQEGEAFNRHVQDLFVSKVKAQYGDYLRRHRAVLAEEFPSHANKESLDRMSAEFEQVFDNLVDRYYVDELRREAEKTADFWRRFEPIEPPAQGEPSLEEQLADYVADWGVLAFTDEAVEPIGAE